MSDARSDTLDLIYVLFIYFLTVLFVNSFDYDHVSDSVPDFHIHFHFHHLETFETSTRMARDVCYGVSSHILYREDETGK